MPMSGACPRAPGHKPTGRVSRSTTLSIDARALAHGRRILASAAFCLCVAVLIITLFRGHVGHRS